MLSRVLGAPLNYFETTPMGRVLNRFTYDMEVIDIVLTQNMSMFMISSSWYVAGVAVMISILPYDVIVIVPVTVIYLYLLLHYRRSGADLQRLDALSRSPIQAMVTEGKRLHAPVCSESSTSALQMPFGQDLMVHQRLEFFRGSQPLSLNFERL